MPLDILGFSPVRKDSQCYWRVPSDFSFVEKLGFVEVAESELLNLSHHLPLLVSVEARGPAVVAVVEASLLRQPLLTEEGRWLRPYIPLALRCLPFRLDSAKLGGDERHVMLMAGVVGRAPEKEGHPLLGEDGNLSPPAAEISGILTRARQGEERLALAAELLLLADVLSPVTPAWDGARTVLYAADPARLPALSNIRSAALVGDGFLPMHLLFALLFSRRLLSPRVQVMRDSSEQAAGGQREVGLDDLAFANLAPMQFALDDSELVPVEAFE